MHTELQSFLRHFAGVVVLTLVPVVITAFLSFPLLVGHHPGEARLMASSTSQHMS